MTTLSATTPADTRLARIITEVAAPWVWCVGLPYAVAFGNDISVLSALAWGTLVAVGAAVVPMGLIMRGMKNGTVSSGHHVTTRTERYLPLAGAGISVAAAMAILLIAHAPQTMVAVTVVMLATVAVCGAITRTWKVSMHASVAAGATVVLIAFYGWPAVALMPVVAAVGWSRVKLKDHTTSQVIVGAVAGMATGLLFPFLT